MSTPPTPGTADRPAGEQTPALAPPAAAVPEPPAVPQTPKVTVYSAPGCQPCAATKRSLDKAGIPYEEIELAGLDEEERARVVEGHTSAPIVRAPGIGTWSGHRPSQIEQVIVQQAAATTAGRTGPTTPGPA